MNEISQTQGVRALVGSLRVSSVRRELAAARLATGKSVNSPLDNPTNFFAAMNQVSRARDFEQLVSTITEGIQTVRVAMNGIEAISRLVESMKGIVAEAEADKTGSTRTALAASFDQMLVQINAIANESSYRGLNLIGRNIQDRMNFESDDLTITFNPEATSTLTVKGTFLGSDVILNDTAGGTPWVTSLDGQSIQTGIEGTFTIGNLTRVELITVFDRINSTNQDTNHDKVIQPGEGMDIDVMVSNGTALEANGVTITNAALIPAENFSFEFGNSAGIGNVPPVTSSITTPNGTDFDIKVSLSAPPTARFRMTFDMTSNGETVNMLFGPFQLNEIRNQQHFEGFTASLSSITLQSANYSSNQFTFQINEPPPPFSRTVNADRKGLGILPSWMYDGFQSEAGIKAAASDLDNALSKLRIHSKSFAVNMDIPAIRKEFTANVIAIAEMGAMNLTAADMNEEGAAMLMSTTRMNLSMTTLSLSIAGEDVLKLLNP